MARALRLIDRRGRPRCVEAAPSVLPRDARREHFTDTGSARRFVLDVPRVNAHDRAWHDLVRAALWS
jgi:hypothetical protein